MYAVWIVGWILERYDDVEHQPARGIPERCNITVFLRSFNELGADAKSEQEFRGTACPGGWQPGRPAAR
jgi:hypothetical protein